ncbi:four helix bundle protein, partial [Desulforudis sp. 1190]|uniref:four helix bundle protein n=1 Tax=Desulforudis sp. 1190 TaxID=3416136 RepID=UPI003CEB8958
QQLRKAAASIPANIAEGYGRKNAKAEFRHFLRNALGSSNEMRVLLNLARDLGYHQNTVMIEEYDVLGKQIYRLIESWS